MAFWVDGQVRPAECCRSGPRLTTRIRGWQSLRHAPPDGLDEWWRRHLEKLADLEALAPAAAAGDTLLHFDIRADNILIGPDGRVWFFDWPHACVGPAWFDAVAFAPSVTMQGGPPPEQVLARYGGTRDTDPSDVTACIASVAGFFTRTAFEPRRRVSRQCARFNSRTEMDLCASHRSRYAASCAAGGCGLGRRDCLGQFRICVPEHGRNAPGASFQFK